MNTITLRNNKKTQSDFSPLSWPATIKAKRSPKPRRQGAVALLGAVPWGWRGRREAPHGAEFPLLPHRPGPLTPARTPVYKVAPGHELIPSMLLGPCVRKPHWEGGSEEIPGCQNAQTETFSLLWSNPAWSQSFFLPDPKWICRKGNLGEINSYS